MYTMKKYPRKESIASIGSEILVEGPLSGTCCARNNYLYKCKYKTKNSTKKGSITFTNHTPRDECERSNSLSECDAGDTVFDIL